MSARTKARRRALDILFEAELRDEDPRDVLAAHTARREANGQQPFNPYVADVVTGVVEHSADIDDRISAAAIGWTLDRMPRVDRAALRIAVWEIGWRADIPDAVAIAEAVAAVQELSTDDSGNFVNGVLAKVAGDQVVP